MLIPLVYTGIGIGVVMLLIGIVTSLTAERSIVDERLGRYLQDQEVLVTSQTASTPVTDWLNVQVERTSFGDRIARELAQADLKLKSGEYIALIIISSGVLGVVGYLYGGGLFPNSLIFASVGVIAGPFLPRFYVKRQQKKRLTTFGEQLPDMLNLMVNGLRAGYSQMQALEAVSKELPPPISDEFKRVVREMQLGISMDLALDNILRRIPSDDLDLVVTAINIQREVGGNLAEILDIISYTIRERLRIKREIEVLVSQVLYSGRILAIMPIALAVFLWGANQSYMQQFFNEDTRLCGIPMLVCGGLMIFSGYLVMNKVADIEV